MCMYAKNYREHNKAHWAEYNVEDFGTFRKNMQYKQLVGLSFIEASIKQDAN